MRDLKFSRTTILRFEVLENNQVFEIVLLNTILLLTGLYVTL